MGKEEAETRSGRIGWFRDSALLVAVATAILYLIGNTYTDSYYGKLGVQESELHFSVAYLMAQSFIPLSFPIVVLFLFMVLCLRFAKPQRTT